MASATALPASRPKPSLAARLADLAPGVLLCAAISLLALALAHVEAALFGRAWLEALVLAILLGTVVRTAWTPGARWKSGINLSAKFLLEVAVVLLGASISAATLLAVGPALLIGIALVVALAIAFSYSVGRMLGLPRRMAVLVACGNSICGNSAIAAVAPVIGADSKDVAASIAFTAVLGVATVLILPVLAPVLALTDSQFGVLAGLTVYAVPQVLAATAPVSMLSVQVGTLVKLVRVLMLGPVVVLLSLFASHLREENEPGAGERAKPSRPPLHKLVPWFILGFLGLAALRSLGLIPEAVLPILAAGATALTIISMAALGLGVDVRVVARAGGPVTAAVVISLVALAAISLGLIHLLAVA